MNDMCGFPWRGASALALSLGLLLAPDAHCQTAARPFPASPPAVPRCAFQREGHPEYVLWICDEDGKAAAGRASILRTRTNRAGAEVVSRVWAGPLADLVRDPDSIIAALTEQHARCTSYFSLARAGRQGPAWNVASRSMREWWSQEGAGRFSNVCYTAEPSSADFIVMWTGDEVPMPNAFSVDLPATGPRSASVDASALPRDDASRALGRIAVYQVNPGFDGAVLRLGPTVLAISPSASDVARETDALEVALRFLSGLPH